MSESVTRLGSAHSGWRQVSLGDICSKPQYGWTTKAKLDSGEIKLLRTTDITSERIDWQRVPFCSELPPDPEKYLVREGDILISRAGSVGVSHLVTSAESSVFASYLIRFRPGPDVLPKYLAYFLKSPAYWKQISDNTAGIAIPNVNASKLQEIRLPLAPPEEQHRIVAELEKQFSRLDEAVANLKRVKSNLREYRRATLEASAKVSLKAARRVTLGEVAFVTKLAGFEYTKFVRYDPGGDLAVIKAENAGHNGFKSTEFSRVRSETVASLTRSKLSAGDLFMVFVGAGTGRVAMVPTDRPYFLGPNVALIRPESLDVDPQFLEYYLRSPTGLGAALSFSKAVAQPSLSMATIRAIPIRLPPLDQQRSAVAEVDRRLSIVGEVEAEVDANLRRAETLRRQILSGAFPAACHEAYGLTNEGARQHVSA